MRNGLDCLSTGVVELDLSGHVLDANIAACKLANATREELIGRDFDAAFPFRFSEPGTIWQEVFRTAKEGTTQQFAVELGAVGNPAFLELQVSPCTEQDRLRSIVCSLNEVTSLHEMKIQAQRMEDRYRIATTAAKIGVWEWRISEDLVEWCDTTLMIHGMTRAQFDGTRECFWHTYHPDDVGVLESKLRGALESNAEFRVQMRILRHNDGEMRWISTRAEVIRDEAGQPIRMVGTVMDVTDRVAAEDERKHLLEAERAARGEAERQSHLKDEFLAMLSHELRTPLTAVIGWSQLLQAGQRSIEEYIDGLAVIERSARAQAQIIGDLLDTNRLASGKIRIDPDEMNLSAVVRDAIQSIQSASEAKQIRIVTDLADPAEMIGDSTRLQQVVWNLLSNAIKFSPPESEIEVRVVQQGSQWRLDVTDRGEGIHPEFLPYIFERFRQGSASVHRKLGGLGLGLSIARQLVELHGGKILVESMVGQGSCFTVLLPIRKLEPERGHPADAAPTLDGMTVAVMDDDQDTLDLVVRLLQEVGADARPARTVADLIELLRQGEVDVILSDISMPDEDGYSILRKIRELPPKQGGDTPAIALTAFSREADRDHALRAGFQLHLTKPIDSATLVQGIRSVAGLAAV